MNGWSPYLGALLTVSGFAITAFVVYTKATAWLAIQFAQFQSTLTEHAKQLILHASRMDRYEARYIEIAEDLQRLIGRMETLDDSPWPRNRRRTDNT